MGQTPETNGWNLDGIIKWRDIAWGVGQVAIHFLFDQVHHDPVNEFDQSSWTPVQKDAAQWMDRVE